MAATSETDSVASVGVCDGGNELIVVVPDTLDAADARQALQHGGFKARAASGTAATDAPSSVAASVQEPPVRVDVDGLPATVELVDWLAGENNHVLILYERPERAFVRALHAQASSDQALTDWRDTARSVLDLCRHDRQRITLADADAAQALPGELVASLSTRLGLAPDHDANLEAGPPPGAATLEQLVATHGVAGSQETLGLLAEIEATSVLVADPLNFSIVDTDSLARIEKRLREQSRESLAMHNRLENENERQLQQIQKMQEFLETRELDYEARFARQRASIESLEIEKKELRRLKEKYQRQIEEVREQRRHHRQRADKLREERQTNKQTLRKLRKQRSEEHKTAEQYKTERDAFERQVERKQAEIDRIKGSRSWRVTAPLRRLRGGGG